MPSVSGGLHHPYLRSTVITNGFLNGNNHSHYNRCQNPLAPEELLEQKPEGRREPEQHSRSVRRVWTTRGGKGTTLFPRKMALCFMHTHRIAFCVWHQPEVGVQICLGPADKQVFSLGWYIANFFSDLSLLSGSAGSNDGGLVCLHSCVLFCTFTPRSIYSYSTAEQGILTDRCIRAAPKPRLWGFWCWFVGFYMLLPKTRALTFYLLSIWALSFGLRMTPQHSYVLF